MVDTPRPWRDRDLLAALAGDWTRRLSGRRVAHLGGGTGWLWLVLQPPGVDDAPADHLVLTARQGAALCWDAPEPPARPLTDALGRIPRKRLTVTTHLLGAELVRAALDAEDLVLGLELRRDDRPLHLLLQLFGQRGNLVLLNDTGRRLWSAHGSPHPAVLRPPRPAPADAAPAADVPPGTAGVLRREAPRHLAAVLATELRRHLGAALRQRRVAAERLVANLERDLARADSGERDRLLAETLAIHLHEIRRGQDAAELTTPTGERVVVPLDPTLPPHVNLERLFHRARKADRGREVVRARLEEARRRLARLEELTGDLDAVDGDDEDALAALLAWRARHADELDLDAAARAARRLPPPLARPFRRYRLAGGWEVWVGRNDRENDELTHRAAAPDDWWLHAQSVPGSHVVLRARGKPEQVPRRVLEQAAQLAALHSRARHAALVPVIYTLRKYVRKPRKSPPGTAACIREKSLMVAPGVPPGAETI